MGCKFDCASKGEIQKVIELGGKTKNIIYANPCKKIEHILFAKEKGVNMMTFDSEEEAIKMKQNFPDAQAVMRIEVVETDAPCPIRKYGVPFENYRPLLLKCREIGLSVRGVSFHVGSGGCNF